MTSDIDSKHGNGGQKHEHELDPLQQVALKGIICLCGSTRFKAQFEAENRRLTLNGCIVVGPGVFGHSNPDGQEQIPMDIKLGLDKLHFKKIDLAEAIWVINVEGYIGESTRNEIEYARLRGKEIGYLERID